jgi:hypothetical protein
MAKRSHSARLAQDRTPRGAGEGAALLPRSRILESPRFALIFAVAYTIIVAVIGYVYHTVGDYNIETDFFWTYVPIAKKVLQGILTIEDFRGPGYPIVLALAGLILRDFFHAGMLLGAVAAGTTLFVMHRLLTRLFGADLAFLAVLLTATNRTFIQYTYTAGTDMVFVAWVAVAVSFFLRSPVCIRRDVILAAFCTAVAYLNRFNGIILLPALPAILLLTDPYDQPWRERWRTAALFVGVTFGAILPWGIYCLVERGSFFYNRNYLNLAFEMFGKGHVSWDEFWYAGPLQYTSFLQVVMKDPVLFLQKIVGNTYEHFVSDMDLLLGWPLGIAVILGIVSFVFVRPTRRQTALLLVGAAFFGVLVTVFYGERFSMFLLPTYAAIALRALSLPSLRSLRLFGTLPIGGVIAIGLIAWTSHVSYQFNRENIDSGPGEIPAIAKTFNTSTNGQEAGKIVVARKPHIAYYLDMRLELFPMAESIDSLRTALRRLDASYLFYSRMEAGLRPTFSYLLEPSRAPAWLVPVTWTSMPPAVLYRIEPAPHQ